jgi:hydrogenase/urease accessory protein HupE
MKFAGFLRPFLAALVLAFLPGVVRAHPIPDIPIRGSFESGGACTIYAEVNPRCFDSEPNTAPTLTYAIYQTLPPERKAELLRQADELVKRCVEFYFEPVGRFQPEFTFEFTGEAHRPLSGSEDVVVLTGTWKTAIASGLTGWKIRATPQTKLAVVFQNFIDGAAHPRLAVLFPGETSFTLDLTTLSGGVPGSPTPGAISAKGSRKDAWSTFVNFLEQGYVHVLPKGLDHILFVLGLFLLSRAVRPLLWQVTTFTLAHSVTLALATLGVVHVPRSVVEPVIAASIAAVALENIFHPRYTPWRLLIVFTFGLVHGLGFASALSDLDLPKASLAVGLVGFNFGVEFAQLTVIGLALLATFWLRDSARYRNWIVIPGSATIAAIGLWWAVQRTFF